MNKYNEIYFRAAARNKVEENGKIWMALRNRNGICEVDKETRCARIIKTFTGESLAGQDLYTHVEKVNQHLIFSPGFAKKIAVYNLEDSSLSYISLKPLKHISNEYQNDLKFWNTFRYQSDIYMLGYSYPSIIKIDTTSMEVTYINDWVDEVEKNIEPGNNDGYFSNGHVICGESAILPIGCMNAVLELNLKTGCTHMKHLKISSKGIGGISSVDGENLWIAGRGRAICKGDDRWIKKSDTITNVISCWNKNTDHIKEITLTDMDTDIYEPFCAPICVESKVFLIPLCASHIYEINIHTGEIKINESLDNILKNTKGSLLPWWKIFALESHENQISFMTCFDYKWHEYNVATGEVNEYYYYIEEDLSDMEQYFNSIYGQTDCMIYESRLPLEYYKEQILNDIEDTYSKNADSIGEKIYRQICQSHLSFP